MVFLCVLCGSSHVAGAQEGRAVGVTRLAVLQAEERRAPTVRDLAIIRNGLHAGDPQTARIAVRALGRLERPALIPDLVPLLRHPLPEVRSEAANAVAQALHGASGDITPNRDAALTSLFERLDAETDAEVRGTICEAMARVAGTAAQTERVEAALTAAAASTSIDVRLGVARGLEVLARAHRKDPPLSEAAFAVLRSMVAIAPSRPGRPIDPSRDVRVRRIALEALVTLEGLDDETIARAMADPDPQVRRLAVRGIGMRDGAGELLTRALTDAAAMVRIHALRAMVNRGADALCAASVLGTGDSNPHVVLIAIDQLAKCSASNDAVAILQEAVDDVASAAKPRAWHRAAHAIVALAAAAPQRAAAALPQFLEARVWQLRMYAARAAEALKDRAALERLAADEDDNVREAAIDGLVKTVGHDADAVYVGELSRHGNQVIRAAAIALRGTSNPEAVPALRAAQQRLVSAGSDNSHDAREAIQKTLAGLGAAASHAPAARLHPQTSELNADDLRRLAAPRARITIQGVGRFELLLFTSEAPATVLRFVRLAEAGYYNGLTFHRVVPNFVIQGGSPGANEYVGDTAFMPDEVGLWPHVRGAAGISTRGRDTGDAQIFIDLVDSPRLNHEYTVFGQVLNGLDVVDQILEGDVIERIEIVTS